MIRKYIKNCLLTLLIIVTGLSFVNAQNSISVSVTVTPPYTYKLSDYYSKVIATLINHSSTGRPIEVKLKGVIKGDNGITLSSVNFVNTTSPIILMYGVPKVLTSTDISNIFNINNLSLTGISKSNLLTNGLPGGIYNFCINAYDYYSGILLTPDDPNTCSADINLPNLTNIEPPQIIKPTENENIILTSPQNVIFSWTFPAGATPGLQYVLRIVDVIPATRNPNDAMSSAVYPYFFEQTLTSNAFVYGPSQPQLKAGHTYAFTVTAKDPFFKVHFKNNGTSETGYFNCVNYNINADSNITLNFINPNSKKNFIEANSETNFLINWNWFNANFNPDTLFISDTIYKKFKVKKYQISVVNSAKIIKKSQKPVSFSRDINETNNMLISYLSLPVRTADSLGFVDSCWYQATVKAFDAQSHLVSTAASVDFQYRKIKDVEPSLQIPVSAVIKYIFKDSVGTLFNATNTPVEICVLKKSNTVTATVPLTVINNVSYQNIAYASATTDNNGVIHTQISVPLLYLTGDSLYFRIQMPDKYYIDKNFSMLRIHAVNRDTSLSFGQQVALTYGYSLKLYVKKAYTTYLINENKGNLDISLQDSMYNSNVSGFHYISSKDGMVYAVEKKEIAAGITVVLYRKNKKNYVPPVEGSISDYSKTSGFTEVARGVTVKESDTSTYVKFNRLLSSIFNGDEYYILALNGSNYSIPNTNTHSLKPKIIDVKNNNQQVNIGSYNIQAFSVNPYLSFAYTDAGFIAQEMPLKVSLPVSITSDDSLYRKITATYNIVSTKPPTSLVKGRIMYHWKSDAGDQLRPYANSKFKVVTDYLVNGKPIGPVTTFSHSGYGYQFNELFFVPQGQNDYTGGMELLDCNATMAVGQTDDQGNFVADVVNVNQKGSLGNGYIVDKGWSSSDQPPQILPGGTISINDIMNPVINPDPGYNNFGYSGLQGLETSTIANEGIQNSINTNSISFNTSTNSFDIGFGGAGLIKGLLKGSQMNMHGPNGACMLKYETPNDGEQLVTFQRVYRIVPENEYIYPTKETFVVNAFETLNIPDPLKSYVKEVSVKVNLKDPKANNLDQMKVTVFRSLADKTPDLPMGEGNGKYKMSELISPQYHTTGETYNNTNANNLQTGGNVFNQQFELLWPDTSNNSDGSITFTTLCEGFEDYYIEACSDPTGQTTYQATFSSVKTDVVGLSDPGYFLGEKSPDPIVINMTLQPLPSRALIRVLDNASKNSIPGSKGGKVTIKDSYSSNSYSTFVDNYGYVEFLDNQSPLSNFNQAYGTSQVSFNATANGYKNNISPNVIFTYNPTGSQFFYNFFLDPTGILKGHIVSLDENKKGVPSYIKVDSGQVVATDANGYFSGLPVPGVVGTKVFVIPKDVAYFDTLYQISPADTLKQTIDLKDYGVYRRKHRIQFVIQDKNYNWPTPIHLATVQLGDTIKKTNNVGVADYIFENVSVNNFTFIVRGPTGMNFIPQTLNLTNIESKSLVMVPVKLETGSEVKGKVTLDGNPVKNAKVYIDVSQQQSETNFFYSQNNTSTPLTNDANLVIAYSDASGNYDLKGVPVDNQTIYLHATLDTSFTVNGDIEPANIKNKTAITNLALTNYKAMFVNNIYGFPLTVEKIVPTNADSSQANVTGVVHWSKAISDFSLDEGNQVMRIEDVIFKSTLVNGRKVGVAQNSSVSIDDISSMKFRYLNKYNVKLTAVKPAGNYYQMYPEPLSISKENDLGVIKGEINIVDNSFNFPSTYLDFTNAIDNFYLAVKTGRTLITNISAVTSAMTETVTNNNNYFNFTAYFNAIQSLVTLYNSQPKKLYNLSNEKGEPITFKLIGFNANANPAKSFIDATGKIHLNVDLSCHIQNAQPADFSLNIDDMVLDDNKVYPASNSSPIKLALENWTLNIKNWSFSTAQGGIVSNEGMINTQVIDIPFNTFVLRSDLFLMDDFQMKNLKMAGGNIALQNINDKNAGLVFDNKTGTDMKPHWRFCISGSPAASLPVLADLSGQIQLNYIQILSNNETVFQLQQQSSPLTIRKNPLTKYSPESIYNGPDYISISGAFNVGAPRMGDIQLFLEYQNPLTMKIKTVQTDFEGQGFVHFVARDPGNNVPNITITQDQVTILGNVVEEPTKTFNEIPSTFFAVVGGSSFYTGGNPVYKVEMDKNFITQLTSDGNAPSNKGSSLQIAQGGMSVVNNDWSLLTYEGYMSSNTPEKDTKPA
ncbi:MAG: hypothetical protein ABR968_10980, partial [Bacteroidales bacterium]